MPVMAAIMPRQRLRPVAVEKSTELVVARSLAVTRILVVVRDGVPAGHAENSPAIYGWVKRRRSSRVPEGRLSDSVVPPGLGM